jgi:hypothetical protein
MYDRRFGFENKEPLSLKMDNVDPCLGIAMRWFKYRFRNLLILPKFSRDRRPFQVHVKDWLAKPKACCSKLNEQQDGVQTQ